ncbi:unnamed protein product [Orchesella dallaii]|uniref:CHHC U11-48K-type domain-containing protein n=1 Tax=Orchesella dallaii TaxID=48710 RepID=A0ABP1QN28_9HEXA
MDHCNPTASSSRSGHSTNQPGIAVVARIAGERSGFENTHEIISVGMSAEFHLPPRSENMRACPYNTTHFVLESCLSTHISQCQQNFLISQVDEGKEVIMLPCLHNPDHQVPALELKHHEEVCPNNPGNELVEEVENAIGVKAASSSPKNMDAEFVPKQENDEDLRNLLSEVQEGLSNFHIQSSSATATDKVSVDSLLQKLVKEVDLVSPVSPEVEHCYVQCARRNRRIQLPSPQANSESNGLETQQEWETNSTESTDDSLDGDDTWSTQWSHPSSTDPLWRYAWYRDPRADYYYY